MNIVSLLFVLPTFALAEKAPPPCPPIQVEKIVNEFSIQQDPAFQCRSRCENDRDCGVIVSSCGMPYFFNKKYEFEVLGFSKNLKEDSGCAGSPVFKEYQAACVKKVCQAGGNTCSAQIKSYEKLLSQSLSQTCTKDSECSYYMAWDKHCPVAKPVSTLRSLSGIEGMLSKAAGQLEKSCRAPNVKKCETQKPSLRCFADRCVISSATVKAHYFLNFEGAEERPNFASRTAPLVMPERDELKCEKNSDCSAVLGLCGQSYLAINKKYADKLLTKIKEKAQSMACYQMNPKAPGVECLLNTCVFPQPN